MAEVVLINLWCNTIADACPRCGVKCCSAEMGEPGEAAFCAGRCDTAGHHHEGEGEVYNNEPCWLGISVEARDG